MILLDRVEQAMAEMPLVAILRGLQPEDAAKTGQILVDAGFRLIEVPLNSPSPFQSIRILRETLSEDVLVGAGTVLDVADVKRLVDVGGQIVVTPNMNPVIIRTTIDLGLVPMPGFVTPTEAFAAVAAGARYLKFFPANSLPITYLDGLLNVLPKFVKVLAVGGVDHTNSAEYLTAGFHGLGLGSCLFKADMTPPEIKAAAHKLVSSIKTG
jgi:2-dehydro-3-deoxyphosphogalactonate aldolase